jgi:para-nitrobenzyl esterase
MNAEQRRIRSVSAEEYWIPSLRVAEAHVKGGGTAFVYRLDYAEPDGRYANLTPHAEDVPFVWNHLSAKSSAGDRQMARTMHAAWLAFIQGGAPHADGLPPWPEYTLNTRPTMLLDRVSRVQDAPQAEELAAWKGKLE